MPSKAENYLLPSIFGACLLLTGLVGCFVYPRHVAPIESVDGHIFESTITGGPGRTDASVVVAVSYVAKGRSHTLTQTVSGGSYASASLLYAVGMPTKVYVRWNKSEPVATLDEPRQPLFLWVMLSIFGATWLVVGYQRYQRRAA